MRLLKIGALGRDDWTGRLLRVMDRCNISNMQLQTLFGLLSNDIHQRQWHGPGVQQRMEGYGQDYQNFNVALVHMMGLEIAE